MRIAFGWFVVFLALWLAIGCSGPGGGLAPGDDAVDDSRPDAPVEAADAPAEVADGPAEVGDTPVDPTLDSPQEAGPPPGRLDELAFTRDWVPGTRDARDRLMTGTETLWLVPHQGMLFAGLGVWNLDPAVENPGPSVLVKRAAGAPWEVDRAFDPTAAARVSALASVTLATDESGLALPAPARFLVAGLRGEVHVRDDLTGEWVASPVPGPVSEIRQVFVHRDTVTGVEALFAALSGGRVLRAVHDPAAAGGLRWDDQPELDDRDGRIMSAAGLMGQAYVAVDLSATRPDNGGLFRRVDGPEPAWERVGGWGKAPSAGVDALGAWLRGLTPVPDPADPVRQVLLAGREAAGVVDRISGDAPAVVEEDEDVAALLAGAWGCPPAGGYVIIAYNDMPAVREPASDRDAHLLGLGILPPGCLDAERRRSGWFLVRDGPGDYRVARVPEVEPADPPAADGLRAVRTIAPSPFAGEEGSVLYFGGFDAARGPHRDTAWIYRGAL